MIISPVAISATIEVEAVRSGEAGSFGCEREHQAVPPRARGDLVQARAAERHLPGHGDAGIPFDGEPRNDPGTTAGASSATPTYRQTLRPGSFDFKGFRRPVRQVGACSRRLRVSVYHAGTVISDQLSAHGILGFLPESDYTSWRCSSSSIPSKPQVSRDLGDRGLLLCHGRSVVTRHHHRPAVPAGARSAPWAEIKDKWTPRTGVSGGGLNTRRKAQARGHARIPQHAPQDESEENISTLAQVLAPN